MEITWIDILIEHLPVASLEEVALVEQEIGFKLPQDFIEIARHNQGRMPNPHYHEADGKGGVLSALFHFNGEFDDGRLGWGDFINEGADTLLLAFCRDGGGNFFAFDYGNDPQMEKPEIVYWDHETRNITKLADTFEEFLGQLKSEYT